MRLYGLLFRQIGRRAGRFACGHHAEIGRLFMAATFAFEAASILLLVALMGAAMIVRRRPSA